MRALTTPMLPGGPAGLRTALGVGQPAHQVVGGFQQEVDVDQVRGFDGEQGVRGPELPDHDSPLVVQRQGAEGVEGDFPGGANLSFAGTLQGRLA